MSKSLERTHGTLGTPKTVRFFFFSCVGIKPPPSAKMPWGYLSVKVVSYNVKRIIYNIYKSMIVYVLIIYLLNGLSMV